MATADQWSALLGRKGSFAGVSPRLYPSDPRTFFEFGHSLRALPDRHPMPQPLALDAAIGFLTRLSSRHPGIRVETMPLPSAPQQADVGRAVTGEPQSASRELVARRTSARPRSPASWTCPPG